MTENRYPPVRLAWSVWGLGACLYLIAFYQRVAPAVLTQELMAEFAIGAAALGNLSAFYFYSYVAMQVPTGILADRWGPRRLLTMGAAVAAVGSFLFAMADTMVLAGLGRLLVGGSVAVAFVGMLKIAAHWFAPRHFALAGGMALFVGIIGAVAAGVPLRLLVDQFDWRPVMAVSAGVTALVALCIWWLVRDDPQERGYRSHALEHDDSSTPDEGITAGLLRVMRYGNVWLLFLVPGGVVGAILAFSGLWGVPYLVTHYAMSTADAAAVCSAMLIAWALGGPLFGALSDRMGRRKPLYVAGCLMLFLAWSMALLVSDLPVVVLIALLLLAGFASGCMIIGFAFARESVPPQLSGTVAGLINMGVMMGPMIMQPAVGWMLDRMWGGSLMEGVRIYGLEAYRSGFLLMLGWAALSLLLILFTRETRCRQLVDR